MATRFGKFQTLAQRLITKNGRSITFRQKGTTPTDPAQPFLGNTGDSNITAPAVFTEYTNTELESSIVQMGDKKCLISALDLPNITPKTKDIIVDGTTQWNVVNVKTLQPGNVAETIMYEIQVRS